MPSAISAAFRAQQIERIEGFLDEAMTLTNMKGHYEVTTLYDEGVDGEDQGCIYNTSAVCVPKWQYRSAKIRFYLQACGAMSDYRLFAVCVHELCHVLLHTIEAMVDIAETDDDGAALCEYAVESVTRAILAAAGRLEG